MTKQMKKKRSLLKYLFAILIVLFILGATSLFFLSRMDINQYKGLICEQFTAYTGQKLTLKGPVSLKLFPIPKVQLEDMALDIKTKDQTQYSLQAKQLLFDFKLLPMLWNDIQIDSYALKNAKLLIAPKNQESHTFQIKKLSGKSDITEDSIHLTDLVIRLNKSSLSGNLTFHLEPTEEGALANTLHNFEGNIQAKALHLVELQTKKETESKSNSNKLFSDKPLGLSELHPFEGSLNLQIDKLVLADNTTLQKVTLPITLNNGTLKAPFKAHMAGGQIKGNLEVTKLKGVPEVKSDFQADGFEMGAFLAAKGQQNVQKGKTHLNFNLTGKGHSVHEIMSTLNGTAFMEMEEATIQNTKIEASTSGALLKSLNPFSKKQKETKIECLVVRLKAKNGVIIADNGIGAQTEHLLILGEGEIHLKPETLELSLSIEPKSSLNLELGEFDRLLKIGGTLKAPKLTPNAAGIVKQGASLFATIATGGTSLLVEKAVEVATKERSPCQFVKENG